MDDGADGETLEQADKQETSLIIVIQNILQNFSIVDVYYEYSTE